MFPIVPYNLSLKNNNVSSSENITSYVTGSSKLLVPGKVIASTQIAQGAMSVAIEPLKLLGQPDVVQISVGQNSFGTIDLEKDSKDIWSEEIHWVRALRLSNDCHSYNIQLRLQPSQRPQNTLSKSVTNPKLILQAVRPIEAGQELLLWFSEDILAMLQIVFLTPANIQGQKKYVCTKCNALYESPNPLKLHVTLNCGRFPISFLWDKMSHIMTENVLHRILQQEMFDFKLSAEPLLMRQRSAIDLSTSSTSSHEEDGEATPRGLLYRPYSEPSAFTPFQKLKSLELRKEDMCKPMPPLWPMIPFDHESFTPQLASLKYDDDAQMETLVSSLGKSKEGHICLYCGKCYSRKYGLKIHIRTHTGYKPLKCKFCLRPFGDPSNLNKHVRLHAEGNTPYKCDLCGKILVRRRDLDRHLKSRHMIEMHPGLNLLDDANNENVEVSDEEKKSSTSVC